MALFLVNTQFASIEANRNIDQRREDLREHFCIVSDDTKDKALTRSMSYITSLFGQRMNPDKGMETLCLQFPDRFKKSDFESSINKELIFVDRGGMYPLYRYQETRWTKSVELPVEVKSSLNSVFTSVEQWEEYQRRLLIRN